MKYIRYNKEIKGFTPHLLQDNRRVSSECIRKKGAGFSLLEVIIAVFVIVIGVIGAVNLISYSIGSVTVGKSRIIATELAQEGLEIVENIRDSNWLEDVNWNDGLGPGDWRAQYNSPSLITFFNTPLQLNSNGFYGYNGIVGFIADKDTFFYRKITISNNPDGDSNTPDIKVISEVTWSERGKSYTINAETRLYDWKIVP